MEEVLRRELLHQVERNANKRKNFEMGTINTSELNLATMVDLVLQLRALRADDRMEKIIPGSAVDMTSYRTLYPTGTCCSLPWLYIQLKY